MQSPIFGKVGSAEPVPLRFLGFGLFWSWLFLVAVTPSALFGALECPGRIPFEMAELALRAAALLCILAISARHLPAHKSVKALLCCAFLAGSVTTPLLLAFGSNPSFALAGAVLAAAADASLFLLWLSFFGYMRLGDALAMLVLSYAAGSVLFLAIVALGRNAMIACATFFPAASCTAFFLSARLYAERTGEAGFLENDEEKGAASEGAPANTQSGAMPTGNTLSRSLTPHDSLPRHICSRLCRPLLHDVFHRAGCRRELCSRARLHDSPRMRISGSFSPGLPWWKHLRPLPCVRAASRPRRGHRLARRPQPTRFRLCVVGLSDI